LSATVAGTLRGQPSRSARQAYQLPFFQPSADNNPRPASAVFPPAAFPPFGPTAKCEETRPSWELKTTAATAGKVNLLGPSYMLEESSTARGESSYQYSKFVACMHSATSRKAPWPFKPERCVLHDAKGQGGPTACRGAPWHEDDADKRLEDECLRGKDEDGPGPGFKHV
jgi:hypothetical protein